MEHRFLSEKKTMIQSLEGVKQNLRETFDKLTHVYPPLIVELEKSLQNSGKILSLYHMHNEQNQNELNELIEHTRETMELTRGSLEESGKEQTELTEHLEKSLEKLSELERLISQIKRDSHQMELISVNAMTVALKAGTAGKGFSFITDELKRLSSQTIMYTETLTGHGAKIQALFLDYLDRVKDANTHQNKTLNEYSSLVLESFQKGVDSIYNLLSYLSSFHTIAETIKPPIARIVEVLQYQDILAQSIDHVLLSLQSVVEMEDKISIEYKLDEYVFILNIIRLARELINDAGKKLQMVFSDLQQNTTAIKQTIESLRSSRQEFTTSETSAETRKSIEKQFNSVKDNIQNITYKLQDSTRNKKRIIKYGKKLTNEINDLDNKFKTFSILVKRFSNINISSRIESAKQEVLRNMNDTVGEMTKLTEVINDHVSIAQNNTKGFIRDTNSVIRNYCNSYDSDKNNSDILVDEVNLHFNNIDEIRVLVEEAIDYNSLYNYSFQELIETTENSLEQFNAASAEFERISILLGGLEKETDEDFSQLLAESGKIEWTLHDNQLQRIISKFTILKHKQLAENIAGVKEKTQGQPEGKVIMFE